jgi:hypothetical protein
MLDMWPTALNGASLEARTMRNRALSRFNRARLAAAFEHLTCLILGRDCALINLESLADQKIGARRYGGIRPVSLDSICGTLGRSGDFDYRFQPLNDRIRDRWVSVAVARSQNIPLAAVELLQVGDRYFVKDGHHRISVARAWGEAAIDAEITIWEPSGGPWPAAIAESTDVVFRS